MEPKATPMKEPKPTLEQQKQAAAREPSLTFLSNSFDQLIRDNEPGFFKTSDFDEAMNKNAKHGNPKFVFGSSTSAFQIEGASEYVGTQWGASVWDVFANKNGYFDSHGQDAVNHTFIYKKDVEMMKDMGLDAYRFSISWPRIFPDGKGPKDEPDAMGVMFYKNLLDELDRAGIKAYVTLFHWDTPLELEREYRGWLSPKIAEDFANYALFCFRTFGDKVEKWITLNEPYALAVFAYFKNWQAPGYGDNYIFPPTSPIVEDPRPYPYIVTHNLLLAHAKAVQKFRIYQEERKDTRGSKEIGITLNSKWFLPHNPNIPADVEAARRALDFYFGWYLDPLVHRRYPESMMQFVTDFTPEEKDLIHNSFDFIGINYYTSQFAAHHEEAEGDHYESHQKLEVSENGLDHLGNKIAIGDERGASGWIISHPTGLKNLLIRVKNEYKNPVIYITENGIDDHNFDHKGTMTKHWASLFDEMRLSYIRDHLQCVLEAMKEGVNVRGYFTWSLLDNFEWNNSFKARFGLIYVDYHHAERKRYLKLSSTWLKHCLKKGRKSDAEAGSEAGKGRTLPYMNMVQSLPTPNHLQYGSRTGNNVIDTKGKPGPNA